MKAIRYTGLILLLFSLGLFLTLFFTSTYELTEEIFEQNVEIQHQEWLRKEFSSVFDRNYRSNLSFVRAIKGAIGRYNEQMRSEQQWNKVIYNDYVNTLTRSSVSGIIVEHTTLLFILVFVAGAAGALLFIIPKTRLDGPPGVKNNGIFFNALNNRGWIGILIGGSLILFYILLYFFLPILPIG